MFKTKLLAATLGLMFAGSVFAAGVSIDEFDSGNQSVQANTGSASQSNLAGPGLTAIGGYRYNEVTSVAGAGNVTSAVAGGVYSKSNDFATAGTSYLVWDSNGVGFAPAIDLTVGGADALLLKVLSIDTGSYSLTFNISDGTNTATKNITAPVAGVQDFLFSTFTNYAATNFTAVKSIELTIFSSDNADLAIDWIRTNEHLVPEPTSLALVGIGAAAAAARRRKA